MGEDNRIRQAREAIHTVMHGSSPVRVFAELGLSGDIENLPDEARQEIVGQAEELVYTFEHVFDAMGEYINQVMRINRLVQSKHLNKLMSDWQNNRNNSPEQAIALLRLLDPTLQVLAQNVTGAEESGELFETGELITMGIDSAQMLIDEIESLVSGKVSV